MSARGEAARRILINLDLLALESFLDLVAWVCIPAARFTDWYARRELVHTLRGRGWRR